MRAMLSFVDESQGVVLDAWCDPEPVHGHGRAGAIFATVPSTPASRSHLLTAPFLPSGGTSALPAHGPHQGTPDPAPMRPPSPEATFSQASPSLAMRRDFLDVPKVEGAVRSPKVEGASRSPSVRRCAGHSVCSPVLGVEQKGVACPCHGRGRGCVDRPRQEGEWLHMDAGGWFEVAGTPQGYGR